jgi:hypothetical protein
MVDSEKVAKPKMMMTMTERSGPTMREAAQELLERTDRTLLAIDGGEVKASDEEYWTFCGFRHALVWVLSYRD